MRMDKPRTADDIRKALKILRDARKNSDELFKSIEKDIAKATKKIKSVNNAQDGAAMAITLFRGLAKLIQNGYKASLSSGKELQKINNDVVEDVVKNMEKQRRDVALKIANSLGKDSKGDSAIMLWTKKGVTFALECQSPSFWTAAYVDIVDNKNYNFEPKRWANLADITHKKQMKKVTEARKSALKNLDKKIKHYEFLLSIAAKELDKRVA